MVFISAHVPDPNSRQAGEKTAFRNLKIYAEEYDVILISFFNKGAFISGDFLRPYCLESHFIEVTKWDKLFACLRFFYAPAILVTRSILKADALLVSVLRQFCPVRVHCEWVQTAFWYNQHSAENAGGVCSINVHDVLIQFTERQSKAVAFARRLLSFDVIRVFHFESSLYKFADKIFVPSLKDRDLIIHKLGINADKVKSMPLCFSDYGFSPNFESDDILFWGAMGRAENEQAAAILINDILPELRRRGYLGTVRVVGSNPPHWLTILDDKSVTVTGFIDDPSTEFHRCGLAVFPLVTGAGVKVKVLECLGAGIPVVTTDIGAEGITVGAAGLLVSSVEGMAHEVMGLLSDRNRRKMMVEAGFAYTSLIKASDVASILLK